MFKRLTVQSLKRVSVELLKWGFSWALPKPTYFFPERTHVRQKQTSLLLLSLNRSFVLTQKSKQKKLLTAVPTLGIARTSSALLSLKRHSQGSTHRADPLNVLVR